MPSSIRSLIKFLVFLLFLNLPSFSLAAGTLQFDQQFVTDGCTGIPDGSWGHCCYEHDLLYWMGGGFDERKAADENMLKCVNDSGGPGYLFYEAVRRLGFTNWAKAWGKIDGATLTAEEIEMVLAERDLWHNLGMPHSYEFPNLETALSVQRTPAHNQLLKEFMGEFSQSAEFQDFYSAYFRALGRAPMIPYVDASVFERTTSGL